MPLRLAQRCRTITLALAVTIAAAASLSAGTSGLHAAPAAGNRFAGRWGRHGFTLEITADGNARATWRIYSLCSDDPTPPCDAVQGDVIIPGGRAAIAFDGYDDTAGDTLYGRILISTDDTLLPPFSDLSLTLLPYGMAELDTDVGAILLCGSEFVRLAPPDLQAEAPCGA